jgi:Tol biopolymer transport system component
MKADGSAETRLTDNRYNDECPSWSPDGTKISFHSDRDGNQEIYIMNSDGSDQIRLTENPARDAAPAFSPDGTRIVFSSLRDGNADIYIMNADGSNQTKLTDDPANDWFPSLSSDGQKILFYSNRDFDQEVYVMDTDGSNPINLTKNAPVNMAFGKAPLPPSEVSLDEIPHKIVFESYRETEGKKNWELCIVNADGSNLINLTNSSDIDEKYPHASPDGQLICFVADEGKDLKSKRRNVYYMNIDGTDRVRVAENAYQPCWSPDGKQIAYLPGEFPRYNSSSLANKGIEIYSLETEQVKRHPNDKLAHLSQLYWAPPDGEWFISGWRTELPGCENAFKVDDDTIMRLSHGGCTPDISHDGKFLVWNGNDWNINIGDLDLSSREHNVTNHKTVAVCDYDHWIYGADFSPDGNFLTFAYGLAKESNICICDLRTGKWTQITTDGLHNKEPDWVPVKVR